MTGLTEITKAAATTALENGEIDQEENQIMRIKRWNDRPDKSSEPDRVFAASTEFGAAWKKAVRDIDCVIEVMDPNMSNASSSVASPGQKEAWAIPTGRRRRGRLNGSRAAFGDGLA